MKPPGNSSPRPPQAGCSLSRASSGPRGGPAGPAPIRALARAPPCRLLLVLLLLPPLAASSRPRAWGAAAPSGGYGPGARCIALPMGPCRGKRRALGSVRSGHVQGSAFRSLPACPPLSFPNPCSFQFTFWSPFLLHSLNFCRFHWKVFSGCRVSNWSLCNLEKPVDGKCSEGASFCLGGGAWPWLREDVMIIVVVCFLGLPSGFIHCWWNYRWGRETLGI